MKIAACTVVAKCQLAYARVLHDSLRRVHPDLPFIVLVVDGGADEPFPTIDIEELGIPELERVRSWYTLQELTYASTPWLLSHLLDRGFDGVAYFKQESLVTGDLSPELALIERHAIVLTPHLTTPLDGDDRVARELNVLQSGIYNVGFLGVSGAAQGRAFIEWWRERCFRHCFHDITRGTHFEQRWLDFVPAYFDDYAIILDDTFNVGNWNLPERDLTTARFIRFSGFDPERPDVVTRYTPRPQTGNAAALFRDYAAMLQRAGWQPLPAETIPYEQRKAGREGRPYVKRSPVHRALRRVARRLLNMRGRR